MVEIGGKTEGKKTTRTIIIVAAALLLILVGVAVLVTVSATGKVADQEKAFQAQRVQLEDGMNARQK